jgi:wyosine [tRNA(Phe)-imidazoG37] synthetase (radical SAM superfamily)
MKYVFGPVTSRRLGQSLGVDPIPLKTCNWNCIYCQLGRSRPLVNERRDYFPPDEIVAEVEEALRAHGSKGIDWVTFLGSGEPLLHAHLGDMLREVKALTPLPVAVLTNGSLLYLPAVRDELSVADAVLPSLDAGTPELYRRINRPHPELTYERLIEGLIAFGQEYEGHLWLEVMLMRGVNDTEGALEDIAAELVRIRPSEIHINLPTRPPAEAWLEPPDQEGLMRAIAILEQVAPVRAVMPVAGTVELTACDSLADAVLAVITRHPLHQEELERMLVHWDTEQVHAALAELEARGRAQVVTRYGKRFWTAAASYFPEARAAGDKATGRRRRQGVERAE